MCARRKSTVPKSRSIDEKDSKADDKIRMNKHQKQIFFLPNFRYKKFIGWRCQQLHHTNLKFEHDKPVVEQVSSDNKIR